MKYLNPVLMIVGALLLYYGYLSEYSSAIFYIPLILGWLLFIVGLMRLK